MALRRTWIVLGLVVLPGCPATPEEAVTRRSLGSQDARAERPCPEQLGLQGCCDGQTLWWCERGLLWSKDCSATPKCGWSASGLYACDTAGHPDPLNLHDKICPWTPGVPPNACGEITIEGCCDGETLKFCDRGAVATVSCGIAPHCGWRPTGPMSGFYDCSTAGAEAPRAVHPKTCPGASPAPLGDTWLSAPDGAPTADAEVGSQPADDGCRCGVAAAPSDLPVWLLLLLLFPRRRR